jgi:hypothetical protein
VAFRWLTLALLPGRYAISRLDAVAKVPPWLPSRGFVSVTRTDEELSIICGEEAVPASVKASRGWRAMKVDGPLPFDMCGVLSSITAPLAEAEVSVFAIATHDTDYVLVTGDTLEKAVKALTRAGHRVRS